MPLRLTASLVLILVATCPALADYRGLLDAARTGHGELVRQMLAAGEPANPPSWHKSYSALQFAARQGNAETVRALIAAGADTGYRDHNGDRALLWAASGGDPETIRALLEAGEPVDSDADPYGNTPLMEATERGHVAAVHLLLEAGADPDRRDQSGLTALHFAARRGGAEIVLLLVATGAEIDPVSEHLRETPLHEAALHGELASLDLLVHFGADIEARDSDGATPLFLAAIAGNPAKLQSLIDAGAEVDAPNEGGNLPVIEIMNPVREKTVDRVIATELLASRTRHIDRAFVAALWQDEPVAADILFERGADPHAVDERGRSAFAGPARLGLIGTLRNMIRKACSTSCPLIERHGVAALQQAAARGHANVVELMLASGVAVDGRDDNGATALMLAAAAGRVAMVELLLGHGADPDPVDHDGKNVADYLTVRPAAIELEIELRSRSRAWRPVDHLELERESLEEAYAQIRALLERARRDQAR